MTAMHVATVLALHGRLYPEVSALCDSIAEKAHGWMDRPKIGRTHLQDAVPLSVGQEWSCHAAQLRAALARLGSASASDGLYPLAVSGTAVGSVD